MLVALMLMKLLHIFAAVVFLGNIIVGVFWKSHGDASKDPRIIAHTLRGIIRADRLFTMPSVTLLLIAGFGAQGMAHYSLSLPWLLASLVLVVLSGAIFMAVLVPIQKKLLAVATAASFDVAAYERLSLQWSLWGTAATLAPLVALVLMIVKPV